MEPRNDIGGGIGRILVNLLAVEFTLRLFLYEIEGPQDPAFNIDRVGEGTFVSETPLTSYDALGALIKKVNKQLAQRGLDARIDDSLVELRDALAHGRILSAEPKGPFRLYKFGRPANGQVRLIRTIDLSPEWFATQTKRAFSEACKIRNLGHSLGFASFPD